MPLSKFALADMSLEDSLEALHRDPDTFCAQVFGAQEKRANNLLDWIKQKASEGASYFKPQAAAATGGGATNWGLTPETQKSMALASLLGGGLGGMYGYLTGDDKTDEGKSNRGKRMLAYGLGGGLLGAGAGYGLDKLVATPVGDNRSGAGAGAGAGTPPVAPRIADQHAQERQRLLDRLGVKSLDDAPKDAITTEGMKLVNEGTPDKLQWYGTTAPVLGGLAPILGAGAGSVYAGTRPQLDYRMMQDAVAKADMATLKNLPDNGRLAPSSLLTQPVPKQPGWAGRALQSLGYAGDNETASWISRHAHLDPRGGGKPGAASAKPFRTTGAFKGKPAIGGGVVGGLLGLGANAGLGWALNNDTGAYQPWNMLPAGYLNDGSRTYIQQAALSRLQKDLADQLPKAP